MPFSYGVPIGLVILVIGAILLFATNNKKAAKIVVGIGAAFTILTLLFIILAANSNM